MIVLTTTYNRPSCIFLLERWLSRQSDKDFRWVIATDGGTDFLPHWAEVVSLEGSRYRHKGKIVGSLTNTHSMLNNLVAGLRYAKEEDICIIEDDEWVRDNYVANVREKLQEAPLIGFTPSLYYHVGQRAFKNLHNVSVAALTCTAWKGEVTPFVRELATRDDVYIDNLLWDNWKGKKKLYDGQRFVISLKGCPGTLGIGTSHTMFGGSSDPMGEKLRQLIGRDADTYLK